MLSSSGQLNQTIDCQNCQQNTESESTTVRHSLKNPSRIEVSIISLSRAKDIFKQLADNEDLPHRYLMDGCYARAHAMGLLMEDAGLISAKAYVEGDLKLKDEDFGELRWSYHVAPMLMVKTKEGNIPYVFDPALFKGPVPFTEWKALLLKNPKSQYSGEFFTSRFIYNRDNRHARQAHYDEEELDHAKETNRSHIRILDLLRMEKEELRKTLKKGKK